MNTRSFLPTNYAVDSRTTIYFITIFLIIYGIVSYYNTPKESFPEVVFPYFSVSAIYPGTSPADMENLVTRPIEKELKTVKGIKQISSNSIQDFSLIMVEFETNIDNSVAYQDVKDAVDDAISELPTDLLDDPTVTKIDLSEFPILNINLSGDLGIGLGGIYRRLLVAHRDRSDAGVAHLVNHLPDVSSVDAESDFHP